MQNTQIIMLGVNSVGMTCLRLRSSFNFRLPTVWDAPSSVYKISVVVTLASTTCSDLTTLTIDSGQRGYVVPN